PRIGAARPCGRAGIGSARAGWPRGLPEVPGAKLSCASSSSAGRHLVAEDADRFRPGMPRQAPALEVLQKLAGCVVQLAELGVLDLPAAVELVDDELGIGADLDTQVRRVQAERRAI